MKKATPKRKSLTKRTSLLVKGGLFLAMAVAGILATVYLVQSPTFKPSQAAKVLPPQVLATVRGTAREGTKVTSDAVQAKPSTLYVANITMKPNREVTSVTGMGLTWEKVKSQCGARDTTGVEMWKAIGSPTGDGSVTASLKNKAENSVIAVSSFSNVDLANPISNIYGFNTSGLNGDCSKGKDSKTYQTDVMTSANALVFGAIATRLRTHTPSAGFAELLDLQFGSDNGDKAGLALISKNSPTAEKVSVKGSLNSDMDWAGVVVSINGQKPVVNPSPTPSPSPRPTPTPKASVAPSPVASVPPGSSPVPTLPPQPSQPPTSSPVKGVWTTPEELKKVPMSGAAWEEMKKAADSLAQSPSPDLDNQDDDTNVKVLAAAIVYARSGDVAYKNKVINALEKIEKFTPNGRTLAWGRETGAYAMAADLIGYRTPAFEKKMRDMAETYIGSQVKKPLLGMFKQRPNNWGFQAFSSLTAIYSYLGDTARLQEIRNYYVDGVTGKKNQEVYGSLSWQCDSKNPRWINPRNCTISCTGGLVNVDGITPDDMRRGDSCSKTPASTGYPWEGLQGLVVAARVLERAGMPIWQVEDRAICRAASALQDGRFGSSWRASGDDEWQLVFLDEACGTNWASSYGNGKWGAGKNAGWAYVTLP